MVAKKERRYVSVKKQTYEKLQNYCKENELTIGSFVESLCLAYLHGKPLAHEQECTERTDRTDRTEHEECPKRTEHEEHEERSGRRFKGIDKVPERKKPPEKSKGPIFSEEELKPWLR